MRLRNFEEFDENRLPSKPHYHNDENPSHSSSGVEMAIDFEDRATKHADGSQLIDVYPNDEEIQIKGAITDPFAIREGSTLSWENMSMTVVSAVAPTQLDLFALFPPPVAECIGKESSR
jgi:hypothetical protein